MSLLDLSVADLLALKEEVRLHRRLLERKEQLALLDLVLRAHKLRLQLEKERARLHAGEGLGL